MTSRKLIIDNTNELKRLINEEDGIPEMLVGGSGIPILTGMGLVAGSRMAVRGGANYGIQGGSMYSGPQGGRKKEKYVMVPASQLPSHQKPKQKRAPSDYNMFVKDLMAERKHLISSGQMLPQDVLREAGALWERMSDAQKHSYAGGARKKKASKKKSGGKKVKRGGYIYG